MKQKAFELTWLKSMWINGTWLSSKEINAKEKGNIS